MKMKHACKMFFKWYLTYYVLTNNVFTVYLLVIGIPRQKYRLLHLVIFLQKKKYLIYITVTNVIIWCVCFHVIILIRDERKAIGDFLHVWKTVRAWILLDFLLLQHYGFTVCSFTENYLRLYIMEFSIILEFRKIYFTVYFKVLENTRAVEM